ncbi:MAG: MmcQ/YjbR family DNA-binding protein [Gaiellaceae bacterium]
MASIRDRLLEFALSLPEAWEDRPWEEDTVGKVRKKIFVFLGGPASTQMTVKLVESHAHALSIEGARPSAYGLGKSGWVTVPLAANGVDLSLLREWIEESYRIVAPKLLVTELDGAE